MWSPFCVRSSGKQVPCLSGGTRTGTPSWRRGSLKRWCRVTGTLGSRLNGQTSGERGRVCVTSEERRMSYQKMGKKQQEGEWLEEGFRRRFRLWSPLEAQFSHLQSSLGHNPNPSAGQMVCCLCSWCDLVLNTKSSRETSFPINTL